MKFIINATTYLLFVQEESMESKSSHNRKRVISVEMCTCNNQPPIKRRRFTSIDSNTNLNSIVESNALNSRKKNDLIQFKHILNTKIPGLIACLSNTEKGLDETIRKLYQVTGDYFKQKSNSIDDEIIVGDDLDLVLNKDNESRTHNHNHKSCPYSANGNNDRYLELKEWVTKDSREINFGTTTLSYRNFVIELGERFCTNDNLSKIHKLIQFDSELKTFGVKFDNGNSGDAQNACILKSYNINWNDIGPKYKKRKLTIEPLPCRLRRHKRKDKNGNLTNKRITHIGESVDSVLKYLNVAPKANVFFLFGYAFDWNEKVLQFKSVTNAKDANIFIQFRLKKDAADCTDTDYKYEFRIFKHWNKYAYQLKLWQKAVCQIISLEIYKQVSQISEYPFDLHGWQCWYRPFKKEITRLPGIVQFEYFGIDEEGNGKIHSTPTAEAIKSEYYILIDPKQTENRLSKYIQNKRIDFSELSTENLNGDRLLQFPIDSYIWEIIFDKEETQNEKILQHITIQQFLGYFLMIHTRSAGVAEYNKQWNRIKHWAQNGYIYGKNSDQKKDTVKGIRKLGKGWKPHSYYTTDDKMLGLLGETNGFTMCAANCYCGPANSKLDKHTEDYKFTGIIWSKCVGEEGQLTIGGHMRGKTNYLWAIPTPNCCYIGYESQGCSMTIDGHAIIPTHLIWKKYQFRICDLYRFVKPELLKLAEEHEKKCNPEQNIICDCLDYVTKYEDLPKAIDISSKFV